VDSWHVNYGYLPIAELLYWYDWLYWSCGRVRAILRWVELPSPAEARREVTYGDDFLTGDIDELCSSDE